MVFSFRGSFADSYDDDDETNDDEDDYDDDDDARTIYSNYYLDGYQYYEPRGPPEPRAEILDPGKTHDVCSCYPNRGDKTKGSMLYDKIKCKHKGGLTGKCRCFFHLLQEHPVAC